MDQRERLALAAQDRSDSRPIIDDLVKIGFRIESIAELFNTKIDYRHAVPLLLEWLPRVSNPAVKEDLVRALSVKWAKGAAPLLVREFERADDELGLGWAIGNALEVLACPAIADEMRALASNRKYGRAREMVVLGLGKIPSPLTEQVLCDLLGDEEVVGHAASALGKLKAARARPQLERLLTHSKTRVRKEAQKALAKIDKASGKG